MRKVSIEQLLHWAFVVELPKAADPDAGPDGMPTASYAFDQIALLGCFVDGSATPWYQLERFTPHADAQRVANAVRDLRDTYFDIDAQWQPFPEWADDRGLIRAEVAQIVSEECGRSGKMRGKHIVQLVITAAILGRGPDWTVDFVPEAVALTRNGKPAWFIQRHQRNRMGERVPFEDNGFDTKKQRPFTGAYRKWKLDQPIRSAVVSRIEWMMWRSALEHLQISLADRLEEHRLARFRPDRCPWVTQDFWVAMPQDAENAG